MIILQKLAGGNHTAFHADSYAQIADRYAIKGCAPGVAILTAEDLEEAEIPAHARALLERDGKVCEMTITEAHSRWFSVSEAPTEAQAVKERLELEGAVAIFETETEAAAYDGPGAQAVRAQLDLIA